MYVLRLVPRHDIVYYLSHLVFALKPDIRNVMSVDIRSTDIYLLTITGIPSAGNRLRS
jgi:hypothetical protein